MKDRRKFEPDWQPTLLKEELVARGVWLYQNVDSYRAELIKHFYDYGSLDLLRLSEILESPYIDDIDYNISDEGVLYFWKFSNGTISKTIGSYFHAREYIETIEGRHEIEWLAEN